MNIDELQHFVDESRLIPAVYVQKLMAVAFAARDVERTSGTSIDSLSELSEALHLLEEEPTDADYAALAPKPPQRAGSFPWERAAALSELGAEHFGAEGK